MKRTFVSILMVLLLIFFVGCNDDNKIEDLEKWDEDGNKVLPTLEQLKIYQANSSEIKGEVYSAITRYYDQEYRMLTCEFSYLYRMYKGLKEMDITFNNILDYNEFLDNKILECKNILENIKLNHSKFEGFNRFV